MSHAAAAAALIALQLAAGSAGAWRVAWMVAEPSRGTPVSDGDALFFLTRAHELVSVSPDGRERWRAAVGEPTDQPTGAWLTVAGDLVIAGDYDVVARNRRSGAPAWTFHPSDGYGPGIYLGASAHGLVTAGSPSGRLYAIDERTGAAAWSLLVDGGGKTTVFRPIVHDGVVYAGYTTFTAPTTGGVVAAELASGRELWRVPLTPFATEAIASTAFAGGPVADGGRVMIATAAGTIVGLTAKTGETQWTIPWTPDVRDGPIQVASQEYRALSMAGGVLVATSMQGRVTAYDPGSRKERWRYRNGANGSATYQLLAGPDALFVPFVGALVELDPRDGRERGRSGPDIDGALWPPLVKERAIYVASRTGFVAFAR